VPNYLKNLKKEKKRVKSQAKVATWDKKAVLLGT
jgi:hypothetical protein